ncbi:MAG: ABC transporter permease [Deltaproteobacteria bacterium]|nr:ABC transporter permease [Deltaproteobacteria bacterium]
MTEKRIPSTRSTTLTIAFVTWLRILRRRALWVSMVIAAMPVLYAGAMMSLIGSGERSSPVSGDLFAIELLVLALLAPMFVATAIGEEVEDRTTTYLWSRPIARWSVLAGKLLTLVPLMIVLVSASWSLAGWIAWDRLPPMQTYSALAACALAMSLVATGIASLSPKHGMALTIVYLLFFDFPLGVLPQTLREMSLGHQVRTLSGMFPDESGLLSAAISLVAIALVWTVVAALRVRRIEA